MSALFFLFILANQSILDNLYFILFKVTFISSNDVFMLFRDVTVLNITQLFINNIPVLFLPERCECEGTRV